MIDLTHLIGFALLAVRQQHEPQDSWKPSSKEADELREGIKQFQMKVINGKKQYPFEQYCASKGLIRFLDNGQFGVLYPLGWNKILKTWDLMKWQDDQDREKAFTAFPEEREEYDARIEKIKVEIRALLTTVKEKMKLV